MQKMFVIHYYINKQILDSYLHIKSEKIWLLFTFVLNWVFLQFPLQWQAFWNFQASKPFIHISIKFHPIPSTIANQRWISIRNILPKSEDFCIWRPFCTLVTMATPTAAILNFFNPPKAATHYGGYFYKVSWSLMKGIQIFFKSSLFCFHGNYGKVCPANSDFFWLSSFH